MQEIKISFSKLKFISVKTIAIVSKATGYKTSEINLNTSINHDLGIDGDDWDDILIALYKNEKVSFEGFRFYDYFNDEAQISNNLVTDTFFFPVRLFLYLFTFRWRYKPFNEFATIAGPPKKLLTIGDLVTSKIEGRFVKREERRFILA